MAGSYISTNLALHLTVSEKTRFTDGWTTDACATAIALLTQSNRAKNKKFFFKNSKNKQPKFERNPYIRFRENWGMDGRMDEWQNPIPWPLLTESSRAKNMGYLRLLLHRGFWNILTITIFKHNLCFKGTPYRKLLGKGDKCYSWMGCLTMPGKAGTYFACLDLDLAEKTGFCSECRVSCYNMTPRNTKLETGSLRTDLYVPMTRWQTLK